LRIEHEFRFENEFFLGLDESRHLVNQLYNGMYSRGLVKTRQHQLDRYSRLDLLDPAAHVVRLDLGHLAGRLFPADRLGLEYLVFLWVQDYLLETSNHQYQSNRLDLLDL
jgi:hypothetical protein